jgi:hypothetical protein
LLLCFVIPPIFYLLSSNFHLLTSSAIKLLDKTATSHQSLYTGFVQPIRPRDDTSGLSLFSLKKIHISQSRSHETAMPFNPGTRDAIDARSVPISLCPWRRSTPVCGISWFEFRIYFGFRASDFDQSNLGSTSV